MKPSGSDMAFITKRMKLSENVKSITLDKLADFILNGHTFSVSYAKNGVSDKNFVSSDIVALDFDNTLSVNEVIKKLDEFNIIPNIIYYTFSHGNKGERFRVISALTETITDKEEYKKIIKGFQSIFGENTDNATVATVQRFLGTNKNLFMPVDLYCTTNKDIFLELYKKTKIIKPINFKSDNFDLQEQIENFDLLSYIRDCYKIDNLKPQGNGYFLDPCPFCGHKGHFKVTDNAFHSFGSDLKCSHISGYGIIQFLKFQFCFDNKQAVDYLKYNLLNLQRNDKSQPIPEFIAPVLNKKGMKTGEMVLTPMLAEHVRKNLDYIFVQDISTGNIQRYIYQEGCYKIIKDDELKGYIKEFITNYNKNLLKMKDVNEVFQNIITDRKFINSKLLNADENIINFKNGILKLDTMELVPHSPKYLSTIQIPCKWLNQDVKTPVYDNFIKTFTNNDSQTKDFLEQFIGVILSNVKGYRFKKALFLVGDGNTGKSQLKSLTEMLLGDGNYTAIDLIDLEKRFGTANLYNKRLAGSSDMGFMDINDLRTFKKVTGGDALFGERKGIDGFEFTYNGLLWFCANQKPRFGGDKGDWVYDRMVFIECNNVIPKHQQDKKLIEKMYAEREGIIRKCIFALKYVIKSGFNFIEPENSIKHLNMYKIENNNVFRFIEECVVETTPSKQKSCGRQKMYNAYEAWCKSKKVYPAGKKIFENEFAKFFKKSINEITTRTKITSVYICYTLSVEAEREYNKEYEYDYM